MKIPKGDEIMWIEVYRDTINDVLDENIVAWYKYEHRVDYPCISILIPVDIMKSYLETNNMTWEYFLNESCTDDFDGLYKFAKGNIIAWNYSK